MCTVLGWVQGWWSVTGLAVEIAGFSALSLDVAREYDRHRTVERYRAGAAAAQRLVDAESSSDDSEPPVTVESSSGMLNVFSPRTFAIFKNGTKP
jgi:hypothetical protein